MTRLIPWILLFSLWALAWPNLANSPPNLENTLAAQNERVSEDPRDPVAWNDLGNLLVVAQRFDEAEQAYRQALALAPGDTSARFNLALLLHQVGRTNDASQELEQLLEIDTHHAWGHYQLGVIHAEKKDRTQALEHYARAFAYDPALTFAENNAHIIDNPLFGEALLMSQRYADSPTTRVPRQYGEPSRILDLMLEDQLADEEAGEGEGEDEDEEGAGARGAGGAMASAQRPAARFEPSRPTAAERRPTPGKTPQASSREGAPTQTLTTVGQAPRSPSSRGSAPEQEATTRSGTTPRGSIPRAPSSRLRRTPPPTPPATNPSGRSESATGAPPPTLRRTPPPPTRSSRYIPSSRRSTSQLELRLLPEEAPGASVLAHQPDHDALHLDGRGR